VRAVGYTRVSTDEQAQHGLSLGDQEQRIREFIEARGWDCVEVLADRGVSGSIAFAARPAGARALAAEADCIVVTAWDRLSRDAADFLAVVRDRHVESVTEEGEPPLLRDLRAVLAQEERRKIAERTRRAAVSIFRQGRYNGPRPLGYKFAGGNLAPVPHEVEIVRRIHFAFVQGQGYSSIARDLNADHIPTVRGGVWRVATIRGLLANPVYIGKVRLHGEIRDGLHEAIIDPEIWEKTQVRIGVQSASKGKARGRLPRRHLFTRGLMRCAECGEAMVPRSQGDSYLCNGRQVHGCRMPMVGRLDIDQAVYAYFEQVGLDVAATRQALAEARDRQLAEIRELASEAQRERRRSQERMARVRRDYQDGRLEAADWSEQRAELSAELEAAGAEAARLSGQQDELRSRDEDLEQLLYRRLLEIREAIQGRALAELEPVRSALVQTFERFVLHRAGSPDAPHRVHLELAAAPGYVIEPVIRQQARTEHPLRPESQALAGASKDIGVCPSAVSLDAIFVEVSA
jgi:site-specific DNA recombinase